MIVVDSKQTANKLDEQYFYKHIVIYSGHWGVIPVRFCLIDGKFFHINFDQVSHQQQWSGYSTRVNKSNKDGTYMYF